MIPNEIGATEIDTEPSYSRQSLPFLVSLTFHLTVVLVGAYLPIWAPPKSAPQIISILEPSDIEPLNPEKIEPQEIRFSDLPATDIGANSFAGDMTALAEAPELAEVSLTPSPEITPDLLNPVMHVEIDLRESLAPSQDIKIVRGAVGVGSTGAAGAVDRITEEIMLSLQERKTLVVWLFDQSPSMTMQRALVNERFDQIYRELGALEMAANPAFAKHSDKPLLTSVVAFGKSISHVLEKPTDRLDEIQEAVKKIGHDESGEEKTFEAIVEAARHFGSYRTRKAEDGGPERNVLLVVFSDEAGDDYLDQRVGLDSAVKTLRKLAIPVFVVGVPAPFGAKETVFKYVDPDPKFDQTPQWRSVNQGPETLMAERVRLSSTMGEDEHDEIDSGFGPFALTRLCYETGGAYFAIHPNRDARRNVHRWEVNSYSAHLKKFFNEDAMRRYRPDYVSANDYTKSLKKNRSREALVRASGMSWNAKMEDPQLRFIKRDEGQFSEALSLAQREAAKLEPKLETLVGILKEGESDRKKETTPRWQAGYDLAYGRVLACYVRTQTYNAMLAAAKRGLKPSEPKNNTWVLQPADEVSVGSQLAGLQQKAKEHLQRVVKDHPDTPWSYLAEKELSTPIGWKWVDSFTDLTPRPQMQGGGGGVNIPRDDEASMLGRPPVRPAPKKI